MKDADLLTENGRDVGLKLNDTYKNEYDTLDWLLSSITNAILVVSEDREILYHNSAAIELFGYPHNELKSIKIDCLIDPKLHDQHAKFVSSYFEKPFSRKMGGSNFISGITKKGDHVQLDIDLKPISFKGCHSVLVNIIDVTERANTEQSMIASYNKLDNIVKVLAHDLTDPLSRIVTSVEVLNNLLSDYDSTSVSKYLNITSQTAEHSLSLIKNLYEYAKTCDSNIGSLDFQKKSIKEVIEQSLHNLDDKIEKENVILINKTEDITIRTVPAILSQIAQNIIANAIKYCPRPLEVQISTYYSRNKLIIAIDDNGPGIPQNKRMEIFEPFVKITNPNSQNNGLGLGLATCRNLVKELGGELWCENSPAAGCRFCISLPC